MKAIALHGQQLHFIDVGEGPTLLLVHGLMSSHRTWQSQLDRLTPGHRVIAPDLFGHGESDKPTGDYSVGAQAAVLRDLLDALSIDRVTVVGHSLGGGIVLQFAYLFPDRVDRIVLVSSGGLGPELHPILRAATLPGSELVLPLLASSWLHRVGDGALRWWSKSGLPTLSPSSVEGWRGLSSLADPDARRAFLATSRSVIDVRGQTVTAQHRLSGLASRPTLLVWGGRDQMIPLSHVEAGRRELPASHVEVFDRSGHFPHLDEPARFARVLVEFMRRPATGGLLAAPDKLPDVPRSPDGAAEPGPGGRPV